jgi:hypothetical protein
VPQNRLDVFVHDHDTQLVQIRSKSAPESMPPR